MLDEKDTGPSRIAFQENKREDQGFAAAEILSPGAVVGGTEYRNNVTSEYF